MLAAERLHGDDTTVPILAKGKTVTGHIWTYVRDDRPFGGRAPPAALYYASRDRRQEHPERHLRGFSGILQADAYSGYNGLYDPARRARADHAGAVLGACQASVLRAGRHRRQCAARQERRRRSRRSRWRRSSASTRSSTSSAAINGLSAARAPARPAGAERTACRRLWRAGCATERSRLSRSASVAKPIDYLLRRWDRFAGFLDDGRICLTNNAAERALRGFALGRKSWLFAGSERGAERAAAMTTLIMTAKLNDVDPLAWLADVLARINAIPLAPSTISSPGTGTPLRPTSLRLHKQRPFSARCAQPAALTGCFHGSGRGRSFVRLQPRPAVPSSIAGGRLPANQVAISV